VEIENILSWMTRKRSRSRLDDARVQRVSLHRRAERPRAQEQVKKSTPDLVLSDMIMPEMDGIKLLEWMRQYDPEVPDHGHRNPRHLNGP